MGSKKLTYYGVSFLFLGIAIISFYFYPSQFTQQSAEYFTVKINKSECFMIFSFLFVGFAVILFYIYPSQSSQQPAEELPNSIYDFTVKDIQGSDVSLSTYKGKVLLIVNVASQCGLTKSNYKELNILYEKYKGQGFEILAFPCNQFGWQEPGSNEEINEAVCSTFKAEFPIFQKIEVNGKNAAPLYKFLKSKKSGLIVDEIKWNFAKFLVDRQGNVIERYAPVTYPLQVESEIQKLLGSS